MKMRLRTWFEAMEASPEDWIVWDTSLTAQRLTPGEMLVLMDRRDVHDIFRITSKGAQQFAKNVDCIHRGPCYIAERTVAEANR